MKSYLVVLEPGKRFRGEDKPIVPGPTSHQAEIMDAHKSLADNLVAEFPTGFFRVLRCS